MSLDLDPACDLSRAKKITLAGQEYFIAPLSLRNVLALPALSPKLQQIDMKNVTGEMFDPVVELIVRGLSRAYPKITKDNLLDMPIDIIELLDAVPIIMQQAGGQQRDSAAGEATATSPSKVPTGTDSSQNS